MTRVNLITRLAALKQLRENRITVVREIVAPNPDDPEGPPVVLKRIYRGSFPMIAPRNSQRSEPQEEGEGNHVIHSTRTL